MLAWAARRYLSRTPTTGIGLSDVSYLPKSVLWPLRRNGLDPIDQLAEQQGQLTALRLDGTRVHPCANLVLAECNWLAVEGSAAGLCDCCALTRTRPADDELPALKSFARAWEVNQPGRSQAEIERFTVAWLRKLPD